jgi:pilus assembly protein CpaE
MPPAEKIKVLIVDDIAETRENIKRLLQFDQNIEVAGTARNGKDAILQAAELKPDVVIMDINMPDMDGITATEGVRQKVPFSQVIILSVQSDPSYMRRAMMAGARDFLNKPPSIDELTAAIHRAGEMAQHEKSKMGQMYTAAGGPGGQGSGIFGTQGKIIVFYSPKGGVGTTTLATNIAFCLKNPENKVIIVDACLQFGDVAVFLNEQPKNTVLDLATRVEELDVDIVEEVTIKHAATGIHVLAAPPKPEMADEVNGEQFGKFLKYIKTIYNYIIVDTATYLTDVVQASLEAADIIILTTTQDIPSIKNASAFLTLADASGIKRDKIIFVMNRFDRRIPITPERVGESLRQPISVSIPFEERMVQSINRGVPFVHDNKMHPFAKFFFTITDLIKERITKLDTAEVEATAKK